MVKRTQVKPINLMNILWLNMTIVGPSFMYDLPIAHTCAIHISCGFINHTR